MMREIKKQAFMGVVWRGGYQAYHHLASLIVKMILVRLLLPSDFGLVAMALIIFTSFDIINRFAGGEPFIRDNISDPNKSKNTLFYLNLICLSLTALIVFCSSSYAGAFFSKKITDTHSVDTLILMIRVFSFKLLLCVPASVPMCMLTKELRFKELYLGNIAGTSGFLVIAPVLAYFGFGVWAIVIGHIAEQIIITMIYFIYSPFIPSLVFDMKIVKNYFKYNSNIFVNAIVIIIITQGDDAIIGRLMGPAILGFYNIGQQFALISFSVVSANINEIIFPVLSKIQNDKEMFNTAVFKAFRLINLLAIPLIGGSVVLARDIVLYFFGEKWLPMVPVFYILSVSSLLGATSSIASPVLKSLNKPHLIRNLQLIKLIFFLFLIYPVAKIWGYLGVCWLMVILSAVGMAYLIPKLAKEVDAFYSRAARTLIDVGGCTFIMMAVVYFIKNTISLNIVSLIVSSSAGAAVYFILLSFKDNRLMNDMRDGLSLLKEKIGHPAT